MTWAEQYEECIRRADRQLHLLRHGEWYAKSDGDSMIAVRGVLAAELYSDATEWRDMPAMAPYLVPMDDEGSHVVRAGDLRKWAGEPIHCRKCRRCKGTGECRWCGGLGRLNTPCPHCEQEWMRPCKDCEGTKRCPSCNGHGEVTVFDRLGWIDGVLVSRERLAMILLPFGDDERVRVGHHVVGWREEQAIVVASLDGECVAALMGEIKDRLSAKAIAKATTFGGLGERVARKAGNG